MLLKLGLSVRTHQFDGPVLLLGVVHKVLNQLGSDALALVIRVDKYPFHHDPVVADGGETDFANQRLTRVTGNNPVIFNLKLHLNHIQSTIIFNKVS